MCKRVYKAREHSQLYSSSKGKGKLMKSKVITIKYSDEKNDCFEEIDNNEELLTELGAHCFGKVYTDMEEFAKDFNDGSIKSNQTMIKIVKE